MGTTALATPSADPTDIRWIERADYGHIFRAVRVNPTDPPIIFLSGIWHKNNTVELGHWGVTATGVPDGDEGSDVIIRLLDPNMLS